MPRLEVDLDSSDRSGYAWITSLVLPRPIAWVSSRSAAGVDNLAPHSFFTVASEDPPVVSFTSVGRKDTLRNIEQTREFVVNLTTEALQAEVNASATDYPPEIGEFDALGLEREPSAAVRPPRVARSPAALECVLAGFHPFGRSTVVFGRVVHLAVDEAMIRDGRPRADLLRPLARLGGAEWTTIGTVSRLRRPRYAGGETPQPG